MSWMMWTALSVVVYFVGFVIAGAWEERGCESKYHPRNCSHPWNTPAPLLWPIVAVIGCIVLPFWLVFGGASKLSHKLAAVPTLAERRAAKQKREQESKKVLRQRVWALEDEMGIERTEYSE